MTGDGGPGLTFLEGKSVFSRVATSRRLTRPWPWWVFRQRASRGCVWAGLQDGAGKPGKTPPPQSPQRAPSHGREDYY